MSFNYGYTCPDIDNNIKDAKEIIDAHITEVFEDLCPPETHYELREYSNKSSNQLYESLEYVFEGLRYSNEAMRSEASRQIEELLEELEEAKQTIRELEEAE